MANLPQTAKPEQAKKSDILGKSETSPIEYKTRREVEVQVRKKVCVFFIGGAGDKRAYPPLPLPKTLVGPFQNIVEVSNHVNEELKLDVRNWLISRYLGYDDVFGDENIKANVVSQIPTITTPVIIIGHSLGGWNGAHLSNWLNNARYNVELLVTLDPVGNGFMVTAFSDIYHKTPHAATKFWINIRAEAKNRDPSDAIADFGEQWDVKNYPTLNAVVDTNHANAIKMFKSPINGGTSAATHVVAAIKRLIG